MAPRFHRTTLDEFADLLDRFPFTRQINAVHMHHTWRPNHAEFRGHDSIVGMWRYHTATKGWSDIAQHLTIDPEGMIWTGRNWNRPPASAAGHNGNGKFGPFMFEIVGDFDRGRDRFEGAQRETSLGVVALVQKRFGLEPESLRFHRAMSDKSCPGTSVEYDEVLAAVRELHLQGVPLARHGADGAAREIPFGPEALALNDVLTSLMVDPAGTRAAGGEAADAEPPENEELRVFQIASGETPDEAAARDGALSPDQLARLRPHVINLRQGEFSGDGRFTTTPGDVEAIFDEHLEREFTAARERGEPLRIVFFAHGGLTSESDALQIAAGQLPWWVGNGVYPVFFVWETGLFETIGQLLQRTRGRTRAAARDIWDYTTDPLVEAAVRALHAPTVWGGMKRSAERASSADGGARFAAQKLAEFCRRHPEGVALHAVGHSAGSIFHAHFVPAALEAGASSFGTLHFLAPAIRVDTFRQQVEPHLGRGIEHLTVFTMRKDLERADHCRRVYRKSLLYLIHHALEPETRAPILGLEDTLRADPGLRRLFGLGVAPSPVAEVVWSKSETVIGRRASQSTSHGGFDTDVPTMNSVLRRVIGKNDTDPLKVGFPAAASRQLSSDWPEAVDWPEGLEFLAETPPADGPTVTAETGVEHAEPLASTGNGDRLIHRRGRRRALCVGINQYARAPLSGCVEDARLWARTLRRLGFDEPAMLLDGQATRSAIMEGMTRLVRNSRPGDVVVFQYSGHGTQVPDASGDEAGGDTPGLDEALCPFDMDSGALLIDDDIAEVMRQTPEGVNVTFFIDCCHSGTISRFGVGAPADGAHDSDERPRFVVADPALADAHLRFRSRLGTGGRSAPDTRAMREVVFSACLSHEVAWESRGQGEFTRRAAGVLEAGVEGLTNEAFLQRVRRAFGANPRQQPDLDCAPGARTRGLLQPIALPAASATVPAPAPSGAGVGALRPNVAELLRMLADQLS